MDTINLEGQWQLTRLSDRSCCPITIPGDICSTLFSHGLIPDPFIDMNELGLQWIGQEDWLLERTLELDAAQLCADQLLLHFDCLDTLADVRLNDQNLATANNMFVPITIDLKPAAVPGKNRLSVLIRSPEKAAALLAATKDCVYPASIYPVHSPHRNLLRKAQYMAGWDWGPCLMTGGIYGKIWLESVHNIRLAACDLSAQPTGADWQLTTLIELESCRGQNIGLTMTLGEQRVRSELELQSGRTCCRLELTVSDPELWWPVGYGKPTLHEVCISIDVAGTQDTAIAGTTTIPSGVTQSTASEVLEVRRWIGFRDVSIDTRAAQDGKAMTIMVNHQPVFAKGANWIPADALPVRWTFEQIKPLLDAALAANMNMIRVWGGGRYESDEFYDYCDKHGLMVWQDFMFGCATYPADKDFLATVEREARAQIGRLKHHPSIMLWCGNNEDLGAINWFEESRNSPARYLVAYDRLNEGVLGRLVQELDPARPWWPSSPSAGPNDYSDNWHSDSSGDMHYWAVWHEGKPFSAYLDIKPRFCSEFGFQSFPSQACLSQAIPADQMNITSPAMEHHQRHPRGNELIMTTMLRYFRMPKGFAETLYLSQVQQALAIKTAVDYWRSTMPRCMGTLYWQLNDVWPCASWSSLEYGGGYKLLHHEARRFYAPCTPLIIVKNNRVHVYVVNERQKPEAAILRIQLRKLSGEVVQDEALPLNLPLASACELWQSSLAELPLAAQHLWIMAELQLDTAVPPAAGEQSEIPLAWSLLCEAKQCSLPDPELSISTVELAPDGETYQLVLECRKPAFNIQLQYRGGEGVFSDGNFMLLPGFKKLLHWRPAAGQTLPKLADFKSGLQPMHLRASYD